MNTTFLLSFKKKISMNTSKRFRKDFGETKMQNKKQQF